VALSLQRKSARFVLKFVKLVVMNATSIPKWNNANVVLMLVTVVPKNATTWPKLQKPFKI
jgi:hypothetical protein